MKTNEKETEKSLMQMFGQTVVMPPPPLPSNKKKLLCASSIAVQTGNIRTILHFEIYSRQIFTVVILVDSICEAAQCVVQRRI